MSDDTFVPIINGDAPGKIIARDVIRRFAIIESLHPEAAVHWLAVPYEPVPSIEELEENNRERFLDLVEFAVSEAKAQATDYPELGLGFTIKFHFGAFETVPHAKLHILSSE
ncbi:MAG: hypothetical protein KC419_11005 [Anaerolineales bacterium]|nr:hypothetical protein [Anaerolineales bacterium]